MEWIVLVIGMAIVFAWFAYRWRMIVFVWFAYRWRIRRQDARREFRTGEPQRMAAEISKRFGAVKEWKKPPIRMNGERPFSKFSLTPREYGEYLLRKGVKKWGRNK